MDDDKLQNIDVDYIKQLKLEGRYKDVEVLLRHFRENVDNMKNDLKNEQINRDRKIKKHYNLCCMNGCYNERYKDYSRCYRCMQYRENYRRKKRCQAENTGARNADGKK